MKNNLILQEKALKDIATKLAELNTEFYRIMFFGSTEEIKTNKVDCICIEKNAIESTLDKLGIEWNYIFDSENQTIQFKVGEYYGEKVKQIRM